MQNLKLHTGDSSERGCIMALKCEQKSGEKKAQIQTVAGHGGRIQLVLCLEKKIMESSVKEKVRNSVCRSLW